MSILIDHKRRNLLLLVALLFIGISSCDSQKRQQPIDGNILSITGVRGEKQLVLPASAKQILIKITSPKEWNIEIRKEKLSEEDWLTVSPSSGEGGQHSLTLKLTNNPGEERAATLFLICANDRDSLKVTQQALGSEIVLGDVSLLECPKLINKEGYYFITHRAEGRVNYSVEYDLEKHHPRWVCFSFDNYTDQVNVKRTDEWRWDPNIPQEYAVDRADFWGFNRGHMVASHDRAFSYTANAQTFYYTNISPQRGKHNTGIWLQLEQLLQGWGRNRSFRDVMYVAKGGTIRNHQIEPNLSGGKIAVPQYYWMTVLIEKNGKYKGIAFWTEHQKPEPVPHISSIVVPIRKLEEYTGIDFFHNLPDDVEEEIETAIPTQMMSEWPGI